MSIGSTALCAVVPVTVPAFAMTGRGGGESGGKPVTGAKEAAAAFTG